MNIEEFKLDIITWVINWVSKYNDQLNAVPCPYAKTALYDGKSNWLLVENPDELRMVLNALPVEGLGNEILTIGMDRNSITPEDLSSIVKNANVTTLMPNNIVALEDHPDDPEIINGVTMNQGKWVVILIQALDKINNASEILKSQGYYKNWSQEAIDDVVSWRFKKEEE